MLWMACWLSRSRCTSESQAIRGAVARGLGFQLDLRTEAALQLYMSMDLGEKVWPFSSLPGMLKWHLSVSLNCVRPRLCFFLFLSKRG